MPRSVATEIFTVSGPVAAAMEILAEEAWRNLRRSAKLPKPSMNWTIRGWAAEYAWRRVIGEVAQRRYCARGFYIGVGEDPRIDIQVETGDSSGEELSAPLRIDVRATDPEYVASWKGVPYPAARLEVGEHQEQDSPDLIVACVAECADPPDWTVRFIGALEWQAAVDLAKGRRTIPGHPGFKCLPLDAFKWEPLEARLPLPPGDWSWR